MEPGCSTVVVPVWNAARWVGETLASIRAQTARDWVCVVVDDGSTDDTAQVVAGVAAADPRVRLVRQRNGGVSAARNTGLAHLPADTSDVAFVDGDDLWHPHALASLRTALAARPDACGVTALARHVDEHGTGVQPGAQEARLRGRPTVVDGRLVLLGTERDTDFASLAVAGRIWPPAVGLFRADAVRAVGGFDTTLRIGEDWDYYLRLARHGPFAFLDEVVVDYRRHPASATADSMSRMVLDLDRVRRKAWEDPANTTDQRDAVRVGWRTVSRTALRSSVGEALWAARHRRPDQAVRAARSAAVIGASLAGRVPPVPDPRLALARRPMVDALRRAVARLQAADGGG